MATQEEADLIFKRLKESSPICFFRRIDETNAGIGAVLHYLYDTGTPVTAGNVSERLDVSTARVAVLLKKMAAKGLIEKTSDKKDARITVVRLSEQGKETVVKIRRDMYRQINQVIDKVGMDRLLNFIEISAEIKAIAKPPEVDFLK